MGRKKKRESKQKQRSASRPVRDARRELAAEAVRVRSIGKPAFLIGLVIVALLVVTAWAALRSGRRGGAAVRFPPPLALEVSDGPTIEDFVGSQACVECHEMQYNAWRQSTHGRAGGFPSQELVLPRFEGRPIRFKDAVVIPSVNDAGDYQFTVVQDGRDAIVLPVAGVVGGGHMVGGGTQGFLSAFADGTLRFLPFDFIRREGVWFCNTNTRTDQGWVPITEDMALADCADWPPARVFGTDERFANCQECHGSQVSIRFDADAGRYETHVASLAINCESCHGPARQHVEWAQAGRLASSPDLGVRALGLLDKDASLEVCFQCHAVKSVIQPGYLPGRRLQDHYSLLAELVGDRPFYPDGRVRTFAYQMNHLASDCYLSGTMNCVACHEPHGQGYRDIYGRPLEGRFSNGQCTSCHASKADDLTAHTFHPPDSPGSQCVSCHMPYLQQKEVGDQLRYARSDHTIPIPRPAFDTELGVENACRGCHRDLSVARLQQVTDSWYGEVKPHKDIVTGVYRAERGETTNPAQELLHPEATHPMAQVAALDLLIENHLRPDMPDLSRDIRTRLEQLAENENWDVRAVALAALHYAAGDDPAVRRFLARRLESLQEDDRVVRDRWVLTLGYYADAFRQRGDLGRAIVVYHKALEVLPEHARILRNLGIAHIAAGNPQAAVEFLERGLATDPQQPLTLVNLGLALEQRGRDLEAADVYRRALAVNPTEPLAYFNLGNFHLRRNEFAEAVAQYRRAVTFDPGLALAHYYLARSLSQVGDFEGALASVRKALEFDQTIAGAHNMLAELERALEGRRE